MTKRLWLAAGLALLTGISASIYFNAEPEKEHRQVKTLDQIQLPDLNGKEQSVSQWQGKVLLINFWATWCPPCREEIPVFLSLRNKFSSAGFEVVGVSIDYVNKVKQYRDSMQINYPLLDGEEKGMAIMLALGSPSGGLPFSVLYDRNGNAVHSKSGPYEQQELQSLIEKYL
ncbi:MAG: TlpA disulfide reductase family protein [Arenicellales bacterium]|jgi:peroxiredoxin